MTVSLTRRPEFSVRRPRFRRSEASRRPDLNREPFDYKAPAECRNRPHEPALVSGPDPTAHLRHQDRRRFNVILNVTAGAPESVKGSGAGVCWLRPSRGRVTDDFPR